MDDRDLIGILSERQAQTGDSDASFARRLGVTREMWRQVKLRQTRPGKKFLRGVPNAYPDLRRLAETFLFTEKS